MIKFNHSKLLGKMRECGYTQKMVANSLRINEGTLSQKINNNSRFTTEEMICICRLLDISSNEIGAYFFAQ